MTHSRSQVTRDPVRYFDDLAGTYARFSIHDANFHARKALFSRLIAADGLGGMQLCLDLGCGNGELTSLAHELGFRAIGFDGSQEMLRLAPRRDDTDDLTYRHERLPLRAEVVDAFRASARLVIASSVIEYLDDDRLFLAQCAALLAPGGRALVSFPNAVSPWRRYERTLGARGHLRGSIIEVQRRQYTMADIRRLAGEVGLRTETVHYFGLPFSPRFLGRALHQPPRWLATMVLVEFRAQPLPIGAPMRDGHEATA